jgi:hypothetical protein
MTTDFRALCTELSGLDGHCVVDCTEEWADAMCRLRAALAEPVAEGPSDEELDAFIYGFFFEDDWYYNTEMERGLARAVLARWGRPTPQPVAASERLPEPEDCDAEGRCWGWWTDPMSEYWEYVGVSAPIEPYGSYIPRAGHTHWLPANALPTPEATND